jgi:hypothetical protein
MIKTKKRIGFGLERFFKVDYLAFGISDIEKQKQVRLTGMDIGILEGLL